GETPILWPLDPQGGPHEVAGTVGEARGNPGGDGRERFHGGIDVRGEEGDPVLAVRGGWVEQINAAGNVGTLNEYVTIGPVTYVHVRVGRDRHDVPLDNAITALHVAHEPATSSRTKRAHPPCAQGAASRPECASRVAGTSGPARSSAR